MKRFITSLLVLVLLISLSGCGNKTEEQKSTTPPIKVQVEQAYNTAYNYYYPKVVIISKVDNLKVKNVITNKGNCSPVFTPKATLKYGSKMEVRYKKCEVMLVQVITDQGNWSFEFE